MITRGIGALAGATGVTFGLFVIMEMLVAFDGELDLDTGEKERFIDFSQVIEEQPPQRMERKVEKPPEPEAPPPEVETPQMEVNNPDALNVGVGGADFAPKTDTMGINLGPSADGDMLPLVRAPAQYPRRAQERGINGYCTVSLTVLEDGTVDPNSIVALDEDPKGMFCRATSKAVARYKYKPRVINGKAQKVENVRYKLTFELENK